jgi:hypothetical protein
MEFPFWGEHDIIFFSGWAPQFYILTNSFTGFSFSTSLSTPTVLLLLDSTHPDACVVVSHYAFDLHLPNC